MRAPTKTELADAMMFWEKLRESAVAVGAEQPCEWTSLPFNEQHAIAMALRNWSEEQEEWHQIGGAL